MLRGVFTIHLLIPILSNYLSFNSFLSFLATKENKLTHLHLGRTALKIETKAHIMQKEGF